MNALIPLLIALSAPAVDLSAPREEAPVPEKATAAPVGDAPPTVSIRVGENGDRVEEYSQNGVIYMVKITPAKGPPYYLMDNDGNGRLDRDLDKDQIAPVYWTVYEWD